MHQEQQFHAAFNTSLVAMIISDDDGNYVDVNPAACELLGRTRDEVIGLNVADMLPASVDVPALWRTFRETGSARGSYVLVRPDGSVRVAEFSAAADITPGRILAVLRDITEQQRARQHQQAQFAVTRILGEAASLDEALSRVMVELATHLDLDLGFLWHVDTAADRLRLQASWARQDLPLLEPVHLDGFRLLQRGEGMPGRAWAEGTALATNDLASHPTSASSRLRQDFGLEVALAFPVGTAGRVEAVIALVGQRKLVEPDELLRVASDIAEQSEQFARRKQAEAALRRSEATLTAAERTAHLGSWLWTAETDEFYWSEEHYRILGLEPGSVTPFMDVWIDAVHPEDRQRVAEAFGRALHSQGRLEVEHRICRPDGSERIVVSIAEPPVVEEGRLVRMTGSVQDVTERRSLEAQFRQAQKMEAIGQLAGGVAHDFNNLLTAILANSDSLLSQIDAEHPFNEELDEIRQAAVRAAALTRQLLAFSRRQTLEPQSVRPSELIAGMQRMLQRVIGEDIELSTSFAPDESFVFIDSGQFEQIVLNLVVNARDAMKLGGSVEIATGRLALEKKLLRRHAEIPPGNYVTLSVRDTGDGIDEATQTRMFEPFYTTKEQGRGTGLGLSTVHGIVQQSGGYIAVDSAPGAGALFTVYLPPCDPPRGRGRHASALPPSPQQSETILLAEDEAIVRRATKRILKAHGYRVIEASGAEDALQIIRDSERHVDVLLTDIVMPGLDGRELSERVALLRPEVRCLFMSGHSYDALDRRGALPGHGRFLHKPFTSAALLEKLRQVCQD